MWDVLYLLLYAVYITSVEAHLYQSRICLSHLMEDVMAEVSVIYRITHPIGDKSGEVLMQGGRTIWACFHS